MDDSNALRIQSQDHPDGWGIGYYPESGETPAPTVIRSISPAFADEEFAAAAGRVAARTVIAHVRRASCGPIALANTHPFHHERWLFAHNGTVNAFERCRAEIEAEIDADLRSTLVGETDSERCFLLVLSRLRARSSLLHPQGLEGMAEALLDTVNVVRSMADRPGEPASSLTFILTPMASLCLPIAAGVPCTILSAIRSRPRPRVPRRMDGGQRGHLCRKRNWAEVPEGGLVGVSASMELLLRA